MKQKKQKALSSAIALIVSVDLLNLHHLKADAKRVFDYIQNSSYELKAETAKENS